VKSARYYLAPLIYDQNYELWGFGVPYIFTYTVVTTTSIKGSGLDMENGLILIA
jgi:hypothetical protein